MREARAFFVSQHKRTSVNIIVHKGSDFSSESNVVGYLRRLAPTEIGNNSEHTLWFCRTSRVVDPVSYTHLDVYKRQALLIYNTIGHIKVI